MSFDNLKLGNYKKSIIFSIFFIAIIVGFYFLVLDKIFQILDLKQVLERKEAHFFKVEQESKRVCEKSEIVKERLENIKREIENSSLKNNYSFKNINSIEIFVEKYINKNFLHLAAIGRCEKDELSKKLYLPYVIQGDLKKLLFFIKEIEFSKMDISFGETPFLLKIDKISSFEGKIKSTINDFEGVDNKNNFRNLSNNLNGKRVEKIKILNFNGQNYLILRYADGTSDVVNEKENIKLIENKIYLR